MDAALSGTLQDQAWTSPQLPDKEHRDTTQVEVVSGHLAASVLGPCSFQQGRVGLDSAYLLLASRRPDLQGHLLDSYLPDFQGHILDYLPDFQGHLLDLRGPPVLDNHA